MKFSDFLFNVALSPITFVVWLGEKLGWDGRDPDEQDGGYNPTAPENQNY